MPNLICNCNPGFTGPGCESGNKREQTKTKTKTKTKTNEKKKNKMSKVVDRCFFAAVQPVIITPGSGNPTTTIGSSKGSSFQVNVKQLTEYNTLGQVKHQQNQRRKEDKEKNNNKKHKC